MNLLFQGAGRFLQPGIKTLLATVEDPQNIPADSGGYYRQWNKNRFFVGNHSEIKEIYLIDWKEEPTEYPTHPWEQSFAIQNNGTKEDEYTVYFYAFYYSGNGVGGTNNAMMPTYLYWRKLSGGEDEPTANLFDCSSGLPKVLTPRWQDFGDYYVWTPYSTWHWVSHKGLGYFLPESYSFPENYCYVGESVIFYNFASTQTATPVGTFSGMSGYDWNDGLTPEQRAENYKKYERHGIVLMNTKPGQPYLYWDENNLKFGENIVMTEAEYEEALCEEDNIDSLDFLTNKKSLTYPSIYDITESPPHYIWEWLKYQIDPEHGYVVFYDHFYLYYTWTNFSNLFGDSIYLTLYLDMCIFRWTDDVEDMPWITDPRESQDGKIYKVYVYKIPITKENIIDLDKILDVQKWYPRSDGSRPAPFDSPDQDLLDLLDRVRAWRMSSMVDLTAPTGGTKACLCSASYFPSGVG